MADAVELLFAVIDSCRWQKPIQFARRSFTHKLSSRRFINAARTSSASLTAAHAKVPTNGHRASYMARTNH